MRTVVIGTGCIACGLIGQLLRASGHEVVFIARNTKVADNFNRVKRYLVHLVGNGTSREINVDSISAIPAENHELAAGEIAAADLVAVSVGCNNLPKVAKLLAMGLVQRSTTVNTLVFENMEQAGNTLRALTAEYLPKEFPIIKYGFPAVLVNRAVARRVGNPESAEPLLFVGDPDPRFYVDASGLCKALPPIEGMIITENFEHQAQKKFSMFSAAHATAAYLGYLKGYKYVHSAVNDIEIKNIVMNVLHEGQQGLSARYGQEIAGTEQDRLDVFERINNAQLRDPVKRVGREPCRKLQANERLINTARLAEDAGVVPKNLAMAITAAMFFYNAKDPSSVELRNHIKFHGIEQTLIKYCGLPGNSRQSKRVIASWNKLHKGWDNGRVLLSLKNSMWT